MGSSRISPTALYTGAVWFANHLSHPALVSPLARGLYRAIRPVDRIYERLSGQAGLEAMLLARHHEIDRLLEVAIAAGEVTEVLEIAAGFSPRGLRFVERHPQLTYVEADLPRQADSKRRLLEDAGLLGRRQRVVPLDALADSGLTDLADAHLSPGGRLAVVTEGLLNYFDEATVRALWRRIAALLAARGGGLYLSDLNLAFDVGADSAARAFRLALQLFSRGRVYLHFQSPAAAEGALREAGFSSVVLRHPSPRVRIVEARAAAR